jgi:hypothetical protein
MVAKPNNLPSVDAELTVPLEPPSRPNLRALRSNAAISDEAVQANSRALGEQWGASTRRPTTKPSTPLESLRLDLPDYLVRALRMKCAEQKVTNAYLVMKALAKDGWHIEETDLVTDRYKRGKR